MSEQQTVTDQHLKVSVDNGVMTIQFNRPQALNAVTREVILALDEAIERAATEARAVVITGDERSFCSGADLAGAANSSGGGGGVGLDVVNALIRKIRDLQVPTVAAVSGPAAGVGCSLALICDYVVMSENSYLMLAFTRIGLMPDGGATALVAASAGRHRALRMALTAEKVKAPTALEWGLASEVASADTYLQRAQEIATTFAQGPTLSLGITEAAINQAALSELDAALDRELEGQATLSATADFKEGVQAFLQKRTAKFEGK
ncbi:enoyl-CoA hydratase [Brevibacterium daeguense]|uniref:Enoyl-CoA hydratase n=1 Tax=Brevibacterium daeguense TaxID=909936 RepID=A0ABP8EGD1_9MICO|nr:enoyl-CoA hydratase [Brevibacterium daeguense]